MENNHILTNLWFTKDNLKRLGGYEISNKFMT